MTRETPIDVNHFAGFHSSRAGAQILEDCRLPILIHHVVPLKDHPTFVFLPGAITRQIGARFNHEPEDTSLVDLFVGITGLGDYVFPLKFARFIIPNLLSDKLAHSSDIALLTLSLLWIFLSERPGDARIAII